jgi:hypothetical protein
VETLLASKEKISKTQHQNIEPQIELMGEEIGIIKQNVYI